MKPQPLLLAGLIVAAGPVFVGYQQHATRHRIQCGSARELDPEASFVNLWTMASLKPDPARPAIVYRKKQIAISIHP